MSYIKFIRELCADEFQFKRSLNQGSEGALDLQPWFRHSGNLERESYFLD